MPEDQWALAHIALCRALEQCHEAGMTEDEVLSAVDDEFHEGPEAYRGGGPKPKRDG